MKRFISAIVVFAVVLLVATTEAQFAPPTAWMYSNGTVLNFVVANNNDEPIYVLKYGTPLENVLTTKAFDIFSNTDGSEVTYVGMMAKRVWPPPIDAYAVLQPGQRVMGSVDLAYYYDFPSAGTYTVRFESNMAIESVSPIEITVSSSAILLAANRRQARYTMTNCGSSTSAKYKNVQSAVSQSIAAANKAKACLSANSCGSQYTTWFGTQTSSRLASITAKFSAIVSAFSGSWVSYCDGSECTPNVYAYVYPNDSKRNIYFCSLFYDNRDLIELINTPVHEMSHFSAVAGTQDYVYGEAACKNLAKTNPDRAISNADNLGYFTYYVR